MSAAAVSSASPLLALLEEDDDQLKIYALKQLDTVVQHFWYQISNYIPQVEALYEDDTFSQRESAALLASKVSAACTLTFHPVGSECYSISRSSAPSSVQY